MSKSPRRSSPVGGMTTPQMKALRTFADNLRKARMDRDWSQSDLAREIWGEILGADGRKSARNRDRISVWERGSVVPDPLNLQKLCDVLGIPQEELAPGLTMETIDKTPPAIHFHMVPGGEGLVHLRVDTMCLLATAVEVVALLSRDPKTAAITSATSATSAASALDPNTYVPQLNTPILLSASEEEMDDIKTLNMLKALRKRKVELD